MVVCAVRYEPVSIGNSLVTGKLTGYFAIWRLLEPVSVRKAAVPQRLFIKFPRKINREKFRRNRADNRNIRVIWTHLQGVCTENLNPNVLTMKSAQYGARIYDAGSLNLPRDRRILVQ